MDLKKQVGARIYELRRKSGLTQAQMSEASSVSNDTISRIERGVRGPSFVVFVVLGRIARALGVEVRELFNFSNRKFFANESRLELTDLLNYLMHRKPREVRMVHKIARVVLEKSKN
jgi:transcriptional regulator with XRE-family HTH domain